ncbi:MAG: hypothetical protein ACI8WA_000006 [Polaribacter sp.]|jgi:hypothetical protein
MCKKVIRMPKSAANNAAEFVVTNSKVGKTYASKCKSNICSPQYIIDTISECSICKKIKSC